jgi:hypothetical protein
MKETEKYIVLHAETSVKTCIPPTNREMGAIGCLFVGIAFAFVHVLLSTILPNTVVSIATKPIPPLLASLACLVVGENVSRIVASVAFLVYAIGDVFLEIEGTAWTEPAGVAAFAVGHIFFIAATFVGKRRSLLREQGLVGRAILIAVLIVALLFVLSIKCDTTYLSRLAESAYLSVLLTFVICLADITHGARDPASICLLLGVKFLVVSDVMAFSRSTCDVPKKFIAYNIAEMVIYYMAILLMAGGTLFLPSWKKK